MKESMEEGFKYTKLAADRGFSDAEFNLGLKRSGWVSKFQKKKLLNVLSVLAIMVTKAPYII